MARLPRLGPDLDPDLDRVAALRPDLVLATLTVPGHERVVEALHARALPFVAPEPVSLEDVYRDVADIARLLGVPERGHRLVTEMRSELGALRSRVGTDPPTVLVEWWPKPVIAPGRRSWTTDVLRAAGARNPLGEEEVKSRVVTDEEVSDLAPDAFVLSWCGVHPDQYRPDVVYQNPGLGRAVRGARWACVLRSRGLPRAAGTATRGWGASPPGRGCDPRRRSSLTTARSGAGGQPSCGV